MDLLILEAMMCWKMNTRGKTGSARAEGNDLQPAKHSPLSEAAEHHR